MGVKLPFWKNYVLIFNLMERKLEGDKRDLSGE